MKTMKTMQSQCSSCIDYPKYKDKGGYGQRKFRGRMMLAHRVAWIEAKGEIPEGMCVMHVCDNPSCVNVEHLRLGTHEENMRDMALKRRSAHRKLTDEQVLEIRNAAGTQHEIARKYGISQTHVCDIKSGVRRQHAADVYFLYVKWPDLDQRDSG